MISDNLLSYIVNLGMRYCIKSKGNNISDYKIIIVFIVLICI